MPCEEGNGELLTICCRELALREGLEFALAAGLNIAIAEIDALKVVQAVLSPEPLGIVEPIIYNIRQGLNRASSGTSCCHVPCESNKAVHLLANSFFILLFVPMAWMLYPNLLGVLLWPKWPLKKIHISL